MRVSSQQARYLAATLCVVVLTIFVDLIVFNNTEAPSDKNEEVMQAQSVYPNTDDGLIKQMAFVNVTLPPPISKTLAERSVDKNEPYLKNSALASHKNTALLATSAPKVASINPDLTSAVAPPQQRQHTLHKSQPEPKQITQHLGQLASLSSNVRSLTFPDANTSQILEYMHTCVGIDVGAINNSKLTVFSHKHSRHSDIVRVASGYTTAQERALLAIYAPGKTLVRLYPYSFDQKLGVFISRVLGVVPLSEFRGEYRVGNNSLWLTNIMINQTHINGDWQLHQGC